MSTVPAPSPTYRQPMTASPLLRRRGQAGISLVVVLLFLVILTLLGLSASLQSVSGERMARNARDHNIALQAAEAALRDARRDIGSVRMLAGRTGASATCDAVGFQGFCLPQDTAGERPVWDLYLQDPARSVALGAITGLSAAQRMPLAPAAGGVSQQPRYLIEPLSDTSDGSLKAGATQYVYRITAIGFGASPETTVILQEVVRF